MRSTCAFSLIELLIAIALIALLAGLALGAVSHLRESGKKVQARSLVAMVQQALDTYRGEDLRRRYPADPAGDPPAERIGFAAPDETTSRPRVGDLLEHVGFARAQAPTVDDGTGIRILRDPWDRDLRYFVDTGASGTAAVRPSDSAGLQVRLPTDVTDWNPTGLRPFAYCWSWGRNLPGSTFRDKAAEWIYVRQNP